MNEGNPGFRKFDSWDIGYQDFKIPENLPCIVKPGKMPRKLIILLLCCSPILLSGQGWQLKQHYPEVAPEGIRSAFAPDSVLMAYRPADDPTVEEVLRRQHLFTPNPETLKPERGDVIWLKLECTNIESTGVRYLMETDQHYEFWKTVDIFEVAGDSVIQTIHTGNELPAAEKPIRNARNLFWLDFQAGEHKVLFIRLVCSWNDPRPALSLRILEPGSVHDIKGFSFHHYHTPPHLRLVFPHCRTQESMEYFIDTTGGLPFAEIQQQWDIYGHFKQEKDVDRAQGFPIWCRLVLINPDTVARYHLMEAGWDAKIVDVYLPQKDGSYRTVRTGKGVPKQEKAIDHTLNLFEYTIGPSDTAEIFVYCHPIPNEHGTLASILIASIHLLEPSSLLAETRKVGPIKGIVLGILIFQLLYFLLRSSLEKNRLGLYYSMIITGFLLFFIAVENMIHTYLAMQIFWYQQHLLRPLGLILFLTGIYLFTNHYLKYGSVFPIIHNLQKLLLLTVILLMAGDFLQAQFWLFKDGSSAFFSFSFFGFSALASALALVLYIILALLAHIRKLPYATNFLIAFSPFFLAFILLAYKFVGIPTDIIYLNILYAGFILTSILFAVVGANRHNEMKIKEAQAENLIALDKAKSEFYSNITHEFRTPLTVIMGLADTLPGNGREKELIKKNSREVLDLVQQLLDISKAQSGHLQLKLTEDNVVPYFEYLIESFHTLAAQKSIDLQFSSEQDEIVMSFDREKLKFILNNLVANAIKFTPAGGIILVMLRREQQQLILKLRDTGIGLSPEEQQQVFDRFYRAEKEGAINRQGDGIGLALTKDLVALLQGEIEVDSSPGQGTTFTVSLPVQPGSAIQDIDVPKDLMAGETRTQPLFPQLAENEFAVLIVDDSVDVLYYLERILSPRYRVIKAHNGREGWETAGQLIPDIVISDVVMPEMDGYQLIEKLKEDPRTDHIPVILLTAKSTQADKVQGLRGGADAYLTKPFHEEELQVRINKLIENRRKLQESFAAKRFHRSPARVLDPFLVNVLDILEKHYEDEQFGIQEFVNALHLSRMQVHRKLKALTDLSTSQFLNNFRLEKGKDLLSEKHLNISEVAYSCGYGDPDYFSKLFSKKYGQSPQAYRNNIKIGT